MFSWLYFALIEFIKIDFINIALLGKKKTCMQFHIESGYLNSKQTGLLGSAVVDVDHDMVRLRRRGQPACRHRKRRFCLRPARST
jgi:hypothetical protein